MTRALKSRCASGGSASKLSLNTHGRPSAPRPIMTDWQPVSTIIRRASAMERTSPLPVTGTRTASTTSPMIAQGARPACRRARGRGCQEMACTPSLTANRAAVEARGGAREDVRVLAQELHGQRALLVVVGGDGVGVRGVHGQRGGAHLLRGGEA